MLLIKDGAGRRERGRSAGDDGTKDEIARSLASKGQLFCRQERRTQIRRRSNAGREDLWGGWRSAAGQLNKACVFHLGWGRAGNCGSWTRGRGRCTVDGELCLKDPGQKNEVKTSNHNIISSSQITSTLRHEGLVIDTPAYTHTHTASDSFHTRHNSGVCVVFV